MSERQPELIAYDATENNAYLSCIHQASEAAGWRLLPFDNEDYAIEDLESVHPEAVVTVLAHSSFTFDFFDGRSLIDVAITRQIPQSVVADQNVHSRLILRRGDIIIPKNQEEVATILSRWLIGLSSKPR